MPKRKTVKRDWDEWDDAQDDWDDEGDETLDLQEGVTFIDSEALVLHSPILSQRRFLSGYTLQILREIAQAHGLKLSGTRKDDYADALAEALVRPEHMEAWWDNLAHPARLLVGATVVLFQGF